MITKWDVQIRLDNGDVVLTEAVGSNTNEAYRDFVTSHIGKDTMLVGDDKHSTVIQSSKVSSLDFTDTGKPAIAIAEGTI